MRKFIAALALISLISIPTLTQTANAAPVSPSSSSFGSNATDDVRAKRAFMLAGRHFPAQGGRLAFASGRFFWLMKSLSHRAQVQ